MELNGALSNPRTLLELPRLVALLHDLRGRSSAIPGAPRNVPTKLPPVLETVATVLDLARAPLRIPKIHVTCEPNKLLGRPVRRSSVKATLAEHAPGHRQRFTRVSHGCYTVLSAALPPEETIVYCRAAVAAAAILRSMPANIQEWRGKSPYQ